MDSNATAVRLFPGRYIMLWINNAGPDGAGYPRHVSYVSDDEWETAATIAGFLNVEALKI
jgi:hypothetical protein